MKQVGVGDGICSTASLGFPLEPPPIYSSKGNVGSQKEEKEAVCWSG